MGLLRVCQSISVAPRFPDFEGYVETACGVGIGVKVQIVQVVDFGSFGLTAKFLGTIRMTLGDTFRGESRGSAP